MLNWTFIENCKLKINNLSPSSARLLRELLLGLLDINQLLRISSHQLIFGVGCHHLDSGVLVAGKKYPLPDAF